MSHISWEEVLVVLIAGSVVFSPALLVLPWILVSRLSEVRSSLWRGLIAALAIPVANAITFALFQSVCTRGHLDHPFEDCGPLPDYVANYSVVLILVVLGAFGAFAVVKSGWLEYQAWNKRAT